MSEFHDERGTDEARKKSASGKMSRREMLVAIGAAGVTAAAGGLLQAKASVASGESQSVVQATYGAPALPSCPNQFTNINKIRLSAWIGLLC